MSKFNLTLTHIQGAYIKGQHLAKSEIEAEQNIERDNVWDVVDEQDFLFEVTGEKFLDFEDAGTLRDSFEEAYYTTWEDHVGKG